MYFEFHVSTLVIAALICIILGIYIGDNSGGNGPDCW